MRRSDADRIWWFRRLAHDALRRKVEKIWRFAPFRRQIVVTIVRFARNIPPTEMQSQV